jgi:hypothetical protein
MPAQDAVPPLFDATIAFRTVSAVAILDKRVLKSYRDIAGFGSLTESRPPGEDPVAMSVDTSTLIENPPFVLRSPRCSV